MQAAHAEADRGAPLQVQRRTARPRPIQVQATNFHSAVALSVVHACPSDKELAIGREYSVCEVIPPPMRAVTRTRENML